MGPERTPIETTVSDRGRVTIPPGLRRRLDIESRDRIRWSVDDGDLTVEILHQRERVFDDFDPVDAGETNAVEAEREIGTE